MLPSSLCPWLNLRKVKPADRARLEAWEAVFQQWLETFANHRTREKYKSAVQRFLAHSGKSPWAVETKDIERYILGYKGAGRYTHNTQYFHLKAIRAFYRFVLSQPRFGGPLCKCNPAEDIHLSSPPLFCKAQALTQSDLRQLFAVIDRHTPLGSRDYALYLLIAGSGLKASQALRLRLSDLSQENGLAWIQSQGVRRWLPTFAWEAVQASLQIASRLDPPGSHAYLFTPLQDLTGVLAARFGPGWSDQPISREKAAFFLRRYTAWAALPPSLLTLESLRSTGFLLWAHLGASLDELAAFLSAPHSYQARWLLDRLEQQPAAQEWLAPVDQDLPPGETLYTRIEQYWRTHLLPAPDQPGLGQRLKSGGQPAEHPAPLSLLAQALTRLVTEEEWQAASAAGGLEEELVALRLINRRIFTIFWDADGLKETLRVYRAFLQTTHHIGQIVKFLKQSAPSDADNAWVQEVLRVGERLKQREQQQSAEPPPIDNQQSKI